MFRQSDELIHKGQCRRAENDEPEALTVAGVGDGAGGGEVKLDEGVWTQADVGGHSVASVGLLYEGKRRAVRAAHGHPSPSRV